MDLPTESAPLPAGYELLDGQFEVLSLLGQGGFAYTYLAYERKLKRNVAIKEYMPDVWSRRNTEFGITSKSDKTSENFNWGLERFLQEAQILATCTHQGVVNVITFFEANGTAYLVMQYEEGEDLDQVLEQRGASFSFEELRRLFPPILQGLSQLHAAGTIHRDIKPSNIIMRRDGTGVLIDFGSARGLIGESAQPSDDEAELTSLVTVGYSPLEQFGTARSDQGPWTDIYALGATLYHLLTGERPTVATDRILADRDPLRRAGTLSKPGFDTEFLEAVDWALETRPRDRPQSVEEWSERLFPGSSPAGSAANSTHQSLRQRTPDGRLSDIAPDVTVLRKPAKFGAGDNEVNSANPSRSATRKRPGGDSKRKMTMIMSACAFVAVVITVGVYLLRPPALDPSNALDEGKWREALQHYDQLGVEQDDKLLAEGGRQRVVNWIQQRIESDLAADRLEQATLLYAQAREEIPDASFLGSLGGAIAKANGTIVEREQTLKKAENRLRENHWHEALALYRSIPETSGLAGKAGEGEQAVASSLVKEIRGSIEGNELDSAVAIHQEALTAFPRNAKFLELGARIGEVRSAHELDKQRVADAAQQLQNGKWREALESYRAIEDGSPYSSQAGSGEQVLAQWLVERIAGHLKENAIEKASVLHKEATTAFPGEPRLVVLQHSLNEKHTILESQQQQIAEGNDSLSNGDWQDALGNFRSVPKNSSVYQLAKRGEQKIVDRLITRIGRLVDGNDLIAAEDLQKEAVAQFPTESRLQSLGPDISALQASGAKDQRELETAHRQLANDRWRDALSTYRSLQSSKSVSELATRGAQAVRSWLVEAIGDFSKNKKWDDAARLSVDGVAAFPNDDLLRSLKDAAENSRASTANNQKLLADAGKAIKNGRWREALKAYRSVSVESDIASQARAGEASVLKWVHEQIQMYLKSGDLDKALSLQESAIGAFRNEKRLESTHIAIGAARREAALRNTPTARAERYLASGQWRKALEEYRSMSRSGEDKVDANRGLQTVAEWLATSLRADLSKLRTARTSKRKSELGKLFKKIIARHAEATQALPDNHELTIDIRLGIADVAYDLRRLTSPSGSNANELLNQVLTINPDNEEALKQKAKIVTWYVQQARGKIGKGALQSADRYISSARSVFSDSDDISRVASELKEARQLAEDRQRAEDALTKAKEESIASPTPAPVEKTILPETATPQAKPTTTPASVQPVNTVETPLVADPPPVPRQVVPPVVPAKSAPKPVRRLPPP